MVSTPSSQRTMRTTATDRRKTTVYTVVLLWKARPRSEGWHNILSTSYQSDCTYIECFSVWEAGHQYLSCQPWRRESSKRQRWQQASPSIAGQFQNCFAIGSHHHVGSHPNGVGGAATR